MGSCFLLAIFLIYILASVIIYQFNIRQCKSLQLSKITSVAAIFFVSGLLATVYGILLSLDHPIVIEGPVWIRLSDFNVSYGWIFDNLSVLYLMMINGLAFLMSMFYFQSSSNFSKQFYNFITPLLLAVSFTILSGNILVFSLGWVAVSLATNLLFKKKNSGRYFIEGFTDILVVLGITGVVGILKLSTLSDFVNLSMNTVNEKATTLIIAVSFVLLGLAVKITKMFIRLLADSSDGERLNLNTLFLSSGVSYIAVYLICRMSYLLSQFPTLLDIMLIVGIVTALAGAVFAVYQVTLTRILISIVLAHTGLSLLICGMGFYKIALYVVLLSSLWSTLLYFLAGVIFHVQGEVDVRKISLQKEKKPEVLILSGVGICLLWVFVFYPNIYGNKYLLSSIADKSLVALILFFVLILLNSLCLARIVANVCFVKDKVEQRVLNDTPWSMKVILIIFCFGVSIVGLVNFSSVFKSSLFKIFEEHMGNLVLSGSQGMETGHASTYQILAFALMVVGMAIVYLLYVQYREKDFLAKLQLKKDIFSVGLQKLSSERLPQIVRVKVNVLSVFSCFVSFVEIKILAMFSRVIEVAITELSVLLNKYRNSDFQKQILTIVFVIVAFVIFVLSKS